MKDSIKYYSVGPLLYCPANNESIVTSLINEKFGTHFSLALCLEDTISDNFLKEAEEILVHSIKALYHAFHNASFFVPKIFIRVRNSKQIPDLLNRLENAKQMITGFIIPKFSLENADEYISSICAVNETLNQPVYLMPILESPTIIHLKNRSTILYSLKEKLDKIENLVLNIRVGGNDLCHMFGFRRHHDESIHKIHPIADILSDIITVFGMDYVISAPVFEYYNGNNWENGLKQELKDDRLCGFVGKTVIHPNQIPAVNEAFKVTQKDFEDAKNILNWDPKNPSLVSAGSGKERMNEYKTHYRWAQKTLFLSEIYGVL